MSDQTTSHPFNTIEDSAVICGFVSYVETSISKLLNVIRQSNQYIHNQVRLSKWEIVFYDDSAAWSNLIPISVFHIQKYDLLKVPVSASSTINGLISTVFSFSTSVSKIKNILENLNSADSAVIGAENDPHLNFDLVKDLLLGLKIGLEELNLSPVAERHITDKIKSTVNFIDQAVGELN
jgi:hypothetical protein